MANYQVRIVIPQVTSLPQDVVVNTLAFGVPGTLSSALTDSLVDFYNTPTTVGSSTQHLAHYLGPQLSRAANACRFEFYEIDLTAGTVGSPLEVVNWQLAGGSTGVMGFPSELAVCSSMAAAPVTGVPAARRRGRIYLGPLNLEVSDILANNEPVIDILFRQHVQAATERLITDTTAGGALLSIWSRTEKELFPVVRGWIDNAWDVQRRRGIEATQRTSWSI